MHMDVVEEVVNISHGSRLFFRIQYIFIKIGNEPIKRCLLLAPFSTRHMQENIVVFTMCCVENKLF